MIDTQTTSSFLLWFSLLISFILLVLTIVMKPRESFGPYLDDACLTYDCGSSEGVKKAIDDCQKNFKASKAYPILSKACSSTDPEIRAQSCVETCDPNDISPYILPR